jgi:hypothetical protein
MASLVSIKIKTGEQMDRIVKLMGPALVLPPHNRHMVHAAEFRLMQILGALADALEANDPPGAPTAKLPGNTTTPNPAAEQAAEKETVLA